MSPEINTDLDHLRLLSIFHYVVGALTIGMSMIWVIYLVLGVVLITSPQEMMSVGKNAEPPPEFVGWLFSGIGAVLVLIGTTFGILVIVSGRNLAKRIRYTYCMVIAAILCIFMPFGTILGIFTLVTLSRASVKELFD